MTANGSQPVRNTKKEGTELLRKLFDKIFKRKKLALILPLVTALAFYIASLFVLDLQGEDVRFVWTTPFVSALAFLFVYFGLRLVIGIRYCPAWYIDTLIFILLLATGLSAIMQIIGFFADPKSFSPSMCICIVCSSAISAAHNRRNIYKDQGAKK
jgi:hypothetical protein